MAVLNDHPVDYFRLDESSNGSGDDGAPAYDYAGGLNAFYTNAIIAQRGYDDTSIPKPIRPRPASSLATTRPRIATPATSQAS